MQEKRGGGRGGRIWYAGCALSLLLLLPDSFLTQSSDSCHYSGLHLSYKEQGQPLPAQNLPHPFLAPCRLLTQKPMHSRPTPPPLPTPQLPQTSTQSQTLRAPTWDPKGALVLLLLPLPLSNSCMQRPSPNSLHLHKMWRGRGRGGVICPRNSSSPLPGPAPWSWGSCRWP